jgi:glucose-1-phosphate adenylyltransferase
MRDTLAMILAGGVGSRLNILVRHRAKPAVPFGGIYRIIDFALSNVMNSGLNQVAILTQYKPLSLMEHVGTGAAWDFVGRTRGIKILPPRTGEKDSDWYKGTADAVRQNLDFVESRPSKHVLILSGDHIYYMDYRDMVKYHMFSDAKVTVAMMTIPWDQTDQFGTGIIDDKGRIVDWEEKPKKARSNLVSMGIYVFNTEYLIKLLRSNKGDDFGRHILPTAMKERKLFAYIFHGYWRDVGTISAYWEANMDLLRPESGLEPETWSICTNVENENLVFDRPPARILPGARIKNSAITKGCILRGTISGSILSPGVVVEKDAKVFNSILMHNTFVGRGTLLNKVVADKEVTIGAGASVGFGNIEVANRVYPEHLSSGITLIGKWGSVPEGAKVGTNCIISQEATSNIWPDNLLLSDGETLE